MSFSEKMSIMKLKDAFMSVSNGHFEDALEKSLLVRKMILKRKLFHDSVLPSKVVDGICHKLVESAIGQNRFRCTYEYFENIHKTLIRIFIISDLKI